MNRLTAYPLVLLSLLVLVSGCHGTPQAEAEKPTDAEGFVSIFNGKDLTDWTIKIAGETLGENYKDTFVIEDGILKVTYDNYQTFDGKFGHLFYNTPHSHYILRMDYRFVEGHCKGAPNYTWINSGVMLHSQSAESMSFTQEFPASIEAQMLGLPIGDKRKRTTANVCTPGTHVFYEGKLDRRHCINSTSKTIYGDQWVALEMEVHGNDKMIFRVDGKDVFALEQPQLDVNDKRDDYAAKKLIEARGGVTQLSDGYIALQAEGAPVQFRNIRIKLLEQ
ncbi:MAG: DUF1080 domain-containing protein [Phycisphaeraceae bacterium]